MYYPIFLNLSHMSCLIVGAGRVGLRKAQGLVQANVKELLIIDKKDLGADWKDIVLYSQVTFEKALFNVNQLQGRGLVFACTTDTNLNTHIAKLCAEQNILCNCVDAPLMGNFIVPAVAKAQAGSDCGLMAAICTEGASPAWSRVLRERLQNWLTPHAPMTILLGRLRPLVLAMGQDSEHNKLIFRALVNSPLSEQLASGNKLCCEELLHSLLPKALHANIAELLHDII